jgi:hypothetical protein
MRLKGGCGRPARPVYLISILIGQIYKLLGCFHGLSRRGDDGFGKEILPGFPVPGQTNVIEQFKIIMTMRF